MEDYLGIDLNGTTNHGLTQSIDIANQPTIDSMGELHIPSLGADIIDETEYIPFSERLAVAQQEGGRQG